jgi:molecular chaperone HtpG
MKTGNISVQTENIFPIIKQFLYSDQEIFLRELVSNAVDATTKLKTLARKGEFSGEVGDLTIHVIVDKEAKTLTIRDRGIGLTEEEAEKYLNQVAFSSAQEFIEKYKGEANIIGHFGLGFYSAFMVADRVEVVTQSHKQNTQSVVWSCDGNPSYSIAASEKTDRGTDIVLHISEDALEYLEEGRIEGLLRKYCRFLPVEIQFGTRTETSYVGEGDDEQKIETEVPNIINNPTPLWKKLPAELNDGDYIEHYLELYPNSSDPLFWIHLNIDYPFNLTGVLYFPKLSNNLEIQKNKIQLYSNQVYVTDEVKEIVPEFLTLLHGVIDSPDIPLNVSRSYLQSDKEVKKITGYITKKVADKLHDLFKANREDFNAKWKDIGMFIKYGILSDEKFDERARSYALLCNVDKACFTIEEYKEKIKALQTDKHNKIIALYTNNDAMQDGYIQAAKQRGYDVLFMDQVLDNHFMQHLEHKVGDITFVRVDSDTVNNLIQKDETFESVLSDTEKTSVETIFKTIANKDGDVSVTPLSPDDQPVTITRAEFMRRFADMQRMNGQPNMFGDMGDHYNVVVNSNHPMVASKLLALKDGDEQEAFAKHLYQLALLGQGMLKGADLTAFIQSSLSFIK